MYDLGSVVRCSTVQVPDGSTGLDVMNKAASTDAKFRFISTNYGNGSQPGVAIVGFMPNLFVPFQSGGYYLELLVGPDVSHLAPSNVGIGTLKPSPNSIIKWVIADSTAAEYKDQSKV